MRWVADPRDELRAFGLLYGALGLCGLVLLHTSTTPWLRLLGCPLHAATGVPCPSCGGTRAAVALAHGHLLQAVRTNALVTAGLLAGMAWALLALVSTAVPRWRGRPQLGMRERAALRALAVAAVAAQWAWLLVQRQG